MKKTRGVVARSSHLFSQPLVFWFCANWKKGPRKASTYRPRSFFQSLSSSFINNNSKEEQSTRAREKNTFLTNLFTFKRDSEAFGKKKNCRGIDRRSSPLSLSRAPRLLEKRRYKIDFYCFTYECCRRRFPLIKMINGVEEVLILLFTAFGYEYLFWSVVVRA